VLAATVVPHAAAADRGAAVRARTELSAASRLAAAVARAPLASTKQLSAVDTLLGSLRSDVGRVLKGLGDGAQNVDTTAEEELRTDFWTLAQLVVDLEASWQSAAQAFPGTVTRTQEAIDRLIRHIVAGACLQQLLSGTPCGSSSG
jgi:hypothetical protein